MSDGSGRSAGRARRWDPPYRVDLLAALAPLRRGRADPTIQLGPDGAWRATLTPAGPATLHLRRDTSGVEATAWGAGAAWALDQLPRLLGADDRPEDLRLAGHPMVELAYAKHGALRLGATDLVWESLAAAILEQKVTGKEARQEWRWLVRTHGTPAPGPAPQGMKVPPPAEVVRAIPSWEWHRAGVGPQRSRALVEVAPLASRFEGIDSSTLDQRLRSRPGIGVWTSAEVRQRSHGDPDAISVGDYHLAAFVGHALIGEPVDDPTMLELLEPWRGQRQRVIRLLMLTASPRERRGPRMSIEDHRTR